MIVAVSVIVYLVVGIATAVMVILTDGEPPLKEQPSIMAVVLFWPICLMIDLPLFLARWIKARRAAGREKPKVFEEEI